MLIKICGITHPEDAEMASSLGADLVGLIFAKKSKRALTLKQGVEIAKTALDKDIEPVGVFVEQSASEIIEICESTKIKKIQLHGAPCKKELLKLSSHFELIYALSVGLEGHFQEEIPKNFPGYLLCDTLSGGQGLSFNWKAFDPPKDPWILAGGLNPENVLSAIKMLQPSGVDVSSGVEKKESVRKDPFLLEKFIKAVRSL